MFPVYKKKISSPEIFRALEQNTSELRKIKSPRNEKTQPDLSSNCSSSFDVDSTFSVKGYSFLIILIYFLY